MNHLFIWQLLWTIVFCIGISIPLYLLVEPPRKIRTLFSIAGVAMFLIVAYQAGLFVINLIV